ncbi:aegerolysin family protein [Zooshikella sp. RANM57]|uniref:aegerolysin family protein n=1 Tax=Zooshikella sp. RANM57 TaxID=3425863 RepID=UPI003D6EC7D3
MAARSTLVIFQNLTGETLSLTNAKLDHGVWTQNMYPPEKVSPDDKVQWASESDGFMTGTEGSVTYHCTDGSVYIHWDNPYIGGNSYSDQAPDGYEITRSGGSGDNATVTFVLQKKTDVKKTIERR